MIVREDGDDLLLIGQTDHSRLVGQFAAHWGNARFATPRPFDTVARAAAFHDYGWLRYETSPILDETRRTPGFRQIPLTAEQLASFQWCIDWLTGIDPYAGLIVGMHGTGLWRARYGVVAYPTAHNPRIMTPALEAFIADNERRQEAARAGYDPSEVWTNYHLMQVWDLLGLYFCCQDPTADHIDPVPLAYGADRAAGVRMALAPKDRFTVAFDPFPFGTAPCAVQLATKRLARQTFADLDDFRRAYFQAPTELMTFRLVPA
jgi:hypothetical protein